MKRRGNFEDECGHGLSRREFVRLASIAGIGSAGALALACSKTNVVGSAAKSATARVTAAPRLKIGYLPITDATPLLVGHAQNLFAAEGLDVDKPVMMRGWAEVAEAFLADTFNLVHLLLPLPIFMRFSQQRHPVK